MHRSPAHSRIERRHISCITYRAEAVICSSKTPASLVDHTPRTGQRNRGAGRGFVSPNCSSCTLALYQFRAAVQRFQLWCLLDCLHPERTRHAACLRLHLITSWNCFLERTAITHHCQTGHTFASSTICMILATYCYCLVSRSCKSQQSYKSERSELQATYWGLTYLPSRHQVCSGQQCSLLQPVKQAVVMAKLLSDAVAVILLT